MSLRRLLGYSAVALTGVAMLAVPLSPASAFTLSGPFLDRPATAQFENVFWRGGGWHGGGWHGGGWHGGWGPGAIVGGLAAGALWAATTVATMGPTATVTGPMTMTPVMGHMATEIAGAMAGAGCAAIKELHYTDEKPLSLASESSVRSVLARKRSLGMPA